MRKRVTVVVCDICEEEFEENGTLEGVVHLDSQESLRFDICKEDTEKLFGKIEPSARRGRKTAAATA